jgi:hypothetical protein
MHEDMNKLSVILFIILTYILPSTESSLISYNYIRYKNYIIILLAVMRLRIMKVMKRISTFVYSLGSVFDWLIFLQERNRTQF